MLDTRPYFSIFLNWSGNEVILIITSRHSPYLSQIVNKVPSIVQFRIFFILLASLVPKPNFLCTHPEIVEKCGLDTFNGKTGP